MIIKNNILYFLLNFFLLFLLFSSYKIKNNLSKFNKISFHSISSHSLSSSFRLSSSPFSSSSTIIPCTEPIAKQLKEKIRGYDLYGRVPGDSFLFSDRLLSDPYLSKKTLIEVVRILS